MTNIAIMAFERTVFKYIKADGTDKGKCQNIRSKIFFVSIGHWYEFYGTAGENAFYHDMRIA